MAPRMTRQAEFARTLGGEPALLDAGALRELNRPEGVEAYFGDMPTQVRLTLTLTLTLILILTLTPTLTLTLTLTLPLTLSPSLTQNNK